MLWWTLRQLNSPKESSRLKAVKSLGTSKDVRAFKHLIFSLKDSSYNVRGCAAEYLGEAGDTRAIEPLCELLKKELIKGEMELKPSEGRRLVESEAELRRRQADAVFESDYVRERVINALDNLGAVKYLISLLADTSAEVREKAARYLGVIGDKRAIEPLLKLLEDESAARLSLGSSRIAGINSFYSDLVLREVIRAVDNLGDEQTKNAFIPLLKDNDRHVRLAAADALEQVESPAVKQALSEYRNSSEGMEDKREAERDEILYRSTAGRSC